MREGGMPAVAIDDVQMGELVGYLSSLQPVPATPSTGAQADQASAEPRLAASQASNQSSGQTAQVRGESHVPLDQLAMRGKIVFQRNACGTCHGVDGLHGTVAAPGLAGTASLLPESALENLLRHHTTRMQKGGMPNTNFSQQDMKAIVAYIRSMSSNTEEHKLLASGYANRKN
jgi:mono/diheme cytochrome c family protein